MVFFRNSSYKKIKSVLEAHGFLISQGGNHAKAFCNEHQTTIIFPRHGKISPGVTDNIVKSLMRNCKIEEDYLKKKLK